MSFNQTNTSREILTNIKCVDLVERLKNILNSGEVSFIHALYNIATPALIWELEMLIDLSTELRNKSTISEEDIKIRDYLLNTLKSYEHNRNRKNNNRNDNGNRNGSNVRIWKPISNKDPSKST